ncbi:MAG: T9SS type A sorting domain-containing protein [Gemmatimonadetes bacterium]|nr:T9SS type A sorting domain-containing protein [Gemmatimonadota bacterium]
MMDGIKRTSHLTVWFGTLLLLLSLSIEAGAQDPPPADGNPPPTDGSQPPPPGDGEPKPPGDGTQQPPPGDGEPKPPGDGTQPPPPGDGSQPPLPGDGEPKPPGDGTQPPLPGDGTQPPLPGDGSQPPLPGDGEPKPPGDGTEPPPPGDGTQPPLPGDGEPKPPGDGTQPPLPGDGTQPPLPGDGEPKPPGDGTEPPPGDGSVGGGPIRTQCDDDGSNCRAVVDLCDEAGNCKEIAVEECREDEKCRELLAGPGAGGPGEPGDGGFEPPPGTGEPGDGGNNPPPGGPSDGGFEPPIRTVCDDDGANCRAVVDLCDEAGNCKEIAVEECREDEKCRELLAGPGAGGPGEPGDGGFEPPPGTGEPGDGGGFEPPIRTVCDDDGTNCRAVVDLCDEAGECKEIAVEECREDEKCRELLAGPGAGGPGEPGDGGFEPPPGGPDGGGFEPPIREVCDDDGANCREVVDLCDEAGECKEIALEECREDEKCRELLAGPGPGGPGEPGDGGFTPPGGPDGGFEPPIREVCDDDGENCREIVDFCDEAGECKEIAVEECREDETCRELLAGPGPGGPGGPGDGGFEPPIREVCDDDGANCREIVDLCDEAGECKEIAVEECREDETCRELLAGPGAGGPGEPGDGGFTPPGGPDGGFEPPIREVCDEDGANCREIVDFCDEAGECKEIALEECREDEKCHDLLAGPGPGGPGGPGEPGDGGPGGPGDGGFEPPIREVCDDDGANCREIVDFCDEAGECKEIAVEECREDEKCRDLLAGPGPGGPGEPGDHSPDGPGDGGFEPPIREICDEDGANCREIVDFCDEAGECKEIALEECREDEKCRDLLAGPGPGGPGGPGEPGDGGPGGPGGGGFEPPIREVCDDDGANCHEVVDFCDEAGECKEIALEECREDETCRDLLAGPGPGGPGGPGDGGFEPPQEGSLGHIIDELRKRFDDDERARVRVKDLVDELDRPEDREFLGRLAGLDGQLTLDEFEQAFGSGPLDPLTDPPKLAFFEGQLDGIDLGEGLLIISQDEYEVAEDVRIERIDGKSLDVAALLDLVGNRPKVAVELNPDDEVQLLIVLSRVDAIGNQDPGPASQDFFGPVGLIDAGKIVLSGPRFAATDRTRFVDVDNQAIDPASLAAGTLVSVTPGAPDVASGSFDPIAIRVQVVDPRKPPPARADIITGHLINTDPVELDGPRAQLTAQTGFIGEDGGALTAADIARGTFVRVTTRAPGFGEDAPVAVEIVVLEGDFADNLPVPPEDDEDSAPREEIRVEGFVQATGSDYIVLQGERLNLDARVLVSDLGGSRTELSGLLQGDLLELDTRPGGRFGFVVTRIQVIDPSVQTLTRPGVIVGAFDGIDGDQLVLAGPFFQVPSDAEVKLKGGSEGGLAALASGDYVRLSASPPRFDRGETLPVAFKIRIATPPKGEPGQGEPGEPVEPAPTGSGRRVVGSFPEDGDVSIPTQTAVQVQFNGDVNGLLFEPDFQFTLFPDPVSLGSLQIGADGRTISAEVELEDGVGYQLVVLSQKTGLFTVRFTTGAQIATASIHGEIALPPELPKQARFVPGESFAVLLDEAPTGELDMRNFDGHVIAGVPLQGPNLVFESLEAGDYYLVLFVNFDLGRGELVQIRAAYDADDDGLADAIAVGSGEEVEIDLALALPAPLQIVALTPGEGETGVGVASELTVEFNKAAELSVEDIRFFPPAVELGELSRSADGTVFRLPLTLADDTIYRVVVEGAMDEEGGALGGASSTVFTTAADFVASRSISGRLVLPALPSARVFAGPVLIGALPADRVDPDRFGIGSFDESDIVASTVATTADFQIDNVPEGDVVIAAFVRVEVPRGYRPPDPRQRTEGDFDLEGKRFNDQVLEVFDTLELFGFSETDEGGMQILSAGTGEATVFLRGSARTREQILPVSGVEFLPGTDAVLSLTPIADPSGQIAAMRVELAEDVQVDDDIVADLIVRFGKVLRVERGIAAIQAAIDGRPLTDFTIEDDGHTIIFPVVLEAGHFQRFSVFKAESIDGGRLEHPIELGLNLLLGDGEAPNFATIGGTLTLLTLDEEGQELTGDAADLIDEAAAILFTQDSGELARVGAAQVSADGTFEFSDVLPGAYQVFAEITTASGQKLRVLYDGDEDGQPDLIVLGDAGGEVTGIDLTASVTVSTEEDTSSGTTVKTTPPGGNADAVVSLVFACDDGPDCSTIQSDVAVGDEVDLDLYVTGAADLDGFSAKLRYDADILEFVSASDAPSDRTNMLRRDGGLALYLPPLLREPELEYGGAILSATELTGPDGDGFLGRFRFRVTDEFEGAQVFLESAVLTSVTGRDELTPAQSAKFAPQVFEEQTKGAISFDFNSASEDQEEFHQGFITPGDLVEVDLYLNFDKIGEDFIDLANYSVTLEFDDEQLSFVSFAPETAGETNVLLAGGGLVPPFPAIVGSSSLTVGAAILGATEAVSPDSSGLIGRLTLATTDAFTETDLMITGYDVKSLNADQLSVSTIIIARMSTDEITRVAAGAGDVVGGGVIGDAAGSDLDGSGLVDFSDFFLFADAFGKQATGSFAAADLDGSGLVDFSDFFLFADSFGKSVGRVAPTQPLAATMAPLTLQSASTADHLVISLHSDQLRVRGYAAQLSYDPSRFELLEVSDEGTDLQAQGRESLLWSQSEPGQILWAGHGTGDAGSVDGVLAELHFSPLDQQAESLFRLDGAIVRSTDGAIVQVENLGEISSRWVPQVFALSPNYPNPFNPSTTISYQLPVGSKIRLEIYDVLGQKVRTLVQGQQVAGVHRVVWDSRNDHGQAVGAGVYFTRFQAGHFQQVNKLLLLK